MCQNILQPMRLKNLTKLYIIDNYNKYYYGIDYALIIMLFLHDAQPDA